MSADFDHEDTADRDAIFRIRKRDADRLLHRTNRLLRWYRAISRQSEMTELSRVQASPFNFEVTGAEIQALDRIDCI